ncbi:MAG: hypothetical protein KBS95_03965 [Alistipes sp.]|nr:hypothetical protein [Candidatus Alistipes equi]
MNDIKKDQHKNVSRGCNFYTDGQGELAAEMCDNCFKLHEYTWMDGYPENDKTDIVEVRFKNTRRSYYRNVDNLELAVGDIVAVEATPGHDIGVISMMGDLVQRQIRRTGFNPFNGEFKKIYRKAKPQDIERWMEAIACEHETMIRSRQIAAQMGLDMKIGDVEYQGDNMKAIFYYIADGRVDFRELIKVFAEQFRVRIEMKQIGARQEAGRIGGIGACGRELCCASWISSFSSVTTSVARLQNLSLNPLKLAGQCSKLKCCLTYEYDVYAEAKKQMPILKEPLHVADGEYYLQKVDALARTMSFSTSKDELINLVTIPVERVWHIISLNKRGEKADTILPSNANKEKEPTFIHEEDSITRFDNSKKNRKRKGQNRDTTNVQNDMPKTCNQSVTEQNDNSNQNVQNRRSGEDKNDNFSKNGSSQTTLRNNTPSLDSKVEETQTQRKTQENDNDAYRTEDRQARAQKRHHRRRPGTKSVKSSE